METRAEVPLCPSPAKSPPKTPPCQRRAEELEKEIVELCGHLNAAEHRFLELVGEEFAGEPWLDSIERLRADGLRLLAERFLSRDTKSAGASADRYQVVVHIDQALLSQPPDRSSDATPRLARSELEDGRAIAIGIARRLACDASLVGIVENKRGEPLDVGRKTRTIPPALSRALKSRDGGCRFPGCGRTLFTEAHHVVHWAHGGKTKLSRHAHRGERIPPHPADHRERPVRAARPAGTSGKPSLLGLNRARGHEIDHRTGACRWLGERMDYGLAVEYLFFCRDRARAGQQTH